jgi:single-strand DNA-binding protein
MKGLNEVRMIGNLGKDPEVKVTESGKVVATFTIAINEKFKDRAGEWKESTEWVRVVVWEKLAEIVKEYCEKGSAVFVGGKMRTRSWEKDDGSKGYTTEVVASNLILLGSSGGGVPAPTEPHQGGSDAAVSAADGLTITDDDIPF